MSDEQSASPEWSRREFMVGTSAALVVAAAAGTLDAQGAAPVPAIAVDPTVPHTTIQVTVNGAVHTVDVEDRWTLAELLRDRLGFTGTKIGCDRGECGACTVLVGLASPDGTLHPVQQAVVNGQGFQCAFCMPGFVMATVGFLKVNPQPTRAELAHGISGNLCRCADYNKILDCMMNAADLMRRA